MNDKQLDKIQKCLELSKSGNANEAANALAMAQKLMSKYGFSDDDLEFAEFGESISNLTIQQKPVLYVNALVTNIAQVFGVIPMVTIKGSKAFAEFVGLKHKADLASYSFDVIYKQLKIARTDYVKTLHHRLLKNNKTIRADSFCEAWVLAVIRNLVKSEISDDEKEKIQAYRKKDKSYSDHGTAKTTRRKGGTVNDYAAGQKAGSKIRVNTPMSGTETKKLGVIW